MMMMLMLMEIELTEQASLTINLPRAATTTTAADQKIHLKSQIHFHQM
jgi:hypothetical protein